MSSFWDIRIPFSVELVVGLVGLIWLLLCRARYRGRLVAFYLIFFAAISLVFTFHLLPRFSGECGLNRACFQIEFLRAPVWRVFAVLVLSAGLAWPVLLANSLHNQLPNRWYQADIKCKEEEQLRYWLGFMSLFSDDPLDTRSHGVRRTRPTPGVGLTYLFATICGGAAWSIMLDFLVWPRVPGVLVSGERVQLNLEQFLGVQQNLTAYLALAGSFVAVWVARRALLGQVRAKSRQEWIDKVRKLCARLVGELSNPPPILRSVGSVRVDLENLELLLNPGELDHRLLLFTLRVGLVPGTEDDRLRSALINARVCVFDWQHALVGHLLGKSHDNRARKRALATGARRLSTAILKREWERVKQTH